LINANKGNSINIVSWCKENRRIPDLRIASDIKFIAKFLVSTDSRVNLFLDACIKAESPAKVPLRWFDTQSIYPSIKLNKFYYSLPTSVKHVSPSAVDDKRDLNGNTKARSTRVVNNHMVEEWKLRENKDYSVFRHKVMEGPMLSTGCWGCHKFHNQGFCFSDCANAASHCQLKGNDFKLFNNRIKALRGE
jgi:hypothetical protein